SEREQPYVAASALTRHLDRARRDVDPDDTTSTALVFQRHSPRAHSDVEHPPAHPAECATLDRGPPGDGCDVAQHRSADEPIVPLDDLWACPVEEHLSKRVRDVSNLHSHVPIRGVPYTVRGRQGSCSWASQTSSGSSARTRSCPSVRGSSSSPNQTATSPPTTTGRPPVSTTIICEPRVWPGAGRSRRPGSSSSSPSTGTYRTPGASTHSRIV